MPANFFPAIPLLSACSASPEGELADSPKYLAGSPKYFGLPKEHHFVG